MSVSRRKWEYIELELLEHLQRYTPRDPPEHKTMWSKMLSLPRFVETHPHWSVSSVYRSARWLKKEKFIEVKTRTLGKGSKRVDVIVITKRGEEYLRIKGRYLKEMEASGLLVRPYTPTPEVPISTGQGVGGQRDTREGCPLPSPRI